MDIEAAKLIGGGLATIGLVGAGVGVGSVWAAYISALSRNPASKQAIGAFVWIGFALTEAVGLFALLIAFMIMFG